MARTVDITRETYNKLVTESENATRDLNGFATSLEVMFSTRPVEVKDENENITNAAELKTWDAQFAPVVHQLKIGKRNAKERVDSYDEARKRFVLRAIIKNADMFAATEKLVLSTIPAK